MFNTSLWIQHIYLYQTQTNKQKNIYFLDSFNVQKWLSKISHIKEDQADVIKITENIIFTIDQSLKASIYVKGLSISWCEILFLWLSGSLSQGL